MGFGYVEKLIPQNQSDPLELLDSIRDSFKWVLKQLALPEKFQSDQAVQRVVVAALPLSLRVWVFRILLL